MKIVINKTYGGFTLSKNVREEYKRLTGEEIKNWAKDSTPRNDENLIKAVEKYIHENLFLKIVEIPDDVKWEIKDYDGIESIHEVHRVWK